MVDPNQNNKAFLKLYFDTDYDMVVMSNLDVSLAPTFGDTVCNFLPNWLKWLCPSPTDTEEILSEMQLFNKLFVSKQYIPADLNPYTGAVIERSVFGVAEENCRSLAKIWTYAFNYSGVSSVDLSYLTSGSINAESAVYTNVGAGGNVVIVNPQGYDQDRIWAALTVLRNLEQQ